jgi:hypothetical protein
LGILDRIVLRPGTTLVGAERLSVAGLRPGHIRDTLGLLPPPQLHNAARASALAEQRIKTVNCGLRAVIKQAAISGQGKGNAIVPGPLGDLTNIAPGRDQDRDKAVPKAMEGATIQACPVDSRLVHLMPELGAPASSGRSFLT